MGLFDLFSNKDAEQAAKYANEGLQRGYDQLSQQYDLGRGALTTNYGKAEDILGGLAGQYQPGFNAYGDASGANGVEGLQRATDQFKNSGQYGVYGFGLDQGLQAIDRTRAAGGMLGSGNAQTDAAKYAQGLASNAWGQYQTGLQPYLEGYRNTVNNQASLYPGLGAQLNASYMGQGGAANQTQTDIGKNLAGQELNNYKIGGNILNAGMGLASLAAGGIGGLGGLGGVLGGIGGALGGNAYGGSASSPLPGLTAADYGRGSNLADAYGVGGGLFSAFS